MTHVLALALIVARDERDRVREVFPQLCCVNRELLDSVRGRGTVPQRLQLAQ